MRYVLPVLLVLLLCQACGPGVREGIRGMNTMTGTEAVARAEGYVRNALVVLPQGARLELLGESRTYDCDDPTDNGPKGRVFASNQYWIRDISQVDPNTYLDGLRRWWSEQGFAIVTDAWRKANVITLENPTNGFRMSFSHNGPDAVIGASSPCVWPNGRPR
jgi:hypothetical protein